MANQVVSSLCERFAARLRDNSSLNYNRHRFYRNGTVRKVFDSNQEDLRQLLQYLCQANNTPLTQLQRVAQRVSTDLGVVFAILLFARGRQEIDVLRQFVDLALETGTDHVAPHQFTDIDLPISLETATNRFPLQGAKFYQKQFQFCAVTLMRREEVVYKGDRFQCPLPYLEETKIGEGAFGQVWKVRIEEQHFQSRSYRTATMEALELARKDFQLDREGENEQMILNTIRDQTRQHRHIMVALASLQYGPTYSLFFPLASCNLWEYLNGVGAEDRPPPSTLQEKSDIYWRGVTLAGALAFLHHEFRDQKFEVFSCYHLDLKPHNILVFDPYTPSETWKIADFGLSRVKGRGPDGEADVELVMPIIARAQRRPRRLQDPSTLNRRGEGTYLAPECSLPSGRVSSASDVWSLGCIISLVMSYIDSGYSGVVEFARQRRRQDHGDKFYTIRHGKPKLSPVVKAWYKHLMYRARASPFPMEHDIVCKTLDFLQKFVLHPTRDQRVTSREVEDTLMSISHLFHRKPSETSSRWWTRRPSMSASYTPDYSQLPLETGAPILGSGFALGGDVLLFHSPQKIQVFFPDEVLSAVGQLPEPRVIRIARASLECVASSSQFLCACLATACFECIFYEIASPPESQENGILEASRVCYPHMGSIKKVAMSANGLLTAFIIKQSPGPSDSDAFVYLSTTESLLNNAREGSISAPSSRSTSAASYQDTDSIVSGGNIISRDSMVGPVAQIRSLTFSKDSHYVVMISQLDPVHLLVRAWDTHSGAPCANLKIRFQGSASLDEPLYTACSVFNREPRLFILCQGRYLLHLSSWRWDGQVHTLRRQAANISVRDDDGALVILGNNGGDRRLRSYILPVPIPGNSEPALVALSNLNQYRPELDSVVLTRTIRRQIVLIVATSRGEFLAVKVPEET